MNPSSRILLWKGNHAIIKTDDEIQNTSKEALAAELEAHPLSLPEARNAILMEDIQEGIVLSSFEVKQNFIGKREFANAEKASRLQTDNPKRALQVIGAEITFFGQSFLEGFLGFYGIKCDNALERYEKRLGIIEEQHLDTGDRKATICQVIQGKFEKLAEYDTIHAAREAQEKLEQGNELKEDMHRRLSNEKDD